MHSSHEVMHNGVIFKHLAKHTAVVFLIITQNLFPPTHLEIGYLPYIDLLRRIFFCLHLAAIYPACIMHTHTATLGLPLIPHKDYPETHLAHAS